jgi:hypothetical protein
MNQGLEGQTRAQMTGDFMNTLIWPPATIVNANQPFSYCQNFTKNQNLNLKF